MITRFDTGDVVLVPVIIEAARVENGRILYSVSPTWDSLIEEERIEGYATYDIDQCRRKGKTECTS